MIGKLTGRFEGTTPEGAALIDVGGVGYAVRTPLAYIVDMKGGTQGATSLFIHTAVREDALDLYGFPTEEELSFFKQLMSVSGIGPKTALNILNITDVATLKRSIAAGDSMALTKVFGIGKKSAERIVVELRDKLAVESRARGEPAHSGANTEIIEALMALGYRADESRRALKAVESSQKKGGTTREILAAALKHLGSGTHTS